MLLIKRPEYIAELVVMYNYEQDKWILVNNLL